MQGVCVATSFVCVGVCVATSQVGVCVFCYQPSVCVCVCVCVLLLVKPTYSEWFRADKEEREGIRREGKHYFYLSSI